MCNELEENLFVPFFLNTTVSVTPTPPILSSNISSHYVTASGNSEDKEVEFLPETKISAVSALSLSPSNLTYDCDYFRNKILGRYPDIYIENLTVKNLIIMELLISRYVQHVN